MINETLIHAIINALKFGSALYICIYIDVSAPPDGR